MSTVSVGYIKIPSMLDYDPEKNELVGLIGTFLNTVVPQSLNRSFVELQQTDDGYGKCNSSEHCTGFFAGFKELGIDVIGMPSPLIIDYDHSPVEIGPVAFQMDHVILSEQDAPKNSRAVDVLESLKNVNWQVAVVYVLWLLFAFQLMRRFLRVISRLETLPKLFWNLLRVLMNQVDIKVDGISIRIIVTCFVVSVAYLFLCYNNEFSTDLTVSEKSKTIDTLEDGLKSKREIWTLRYNPSMAAFSEARSGLFRDIWLKILETEETGYLLPEPLGVQGMITAIKDKKAISIMPSGTIKGMTLGYCMQLFADGISRPFGLHISKNAYLETVFATAFNIKSRTAIKEKLRAHGTRVIESGFMVLFLDTLHTRLQENAGLQQNTAVKLCTGHVSEFPGVVPVKLNNTYGLFSGICVGVSFALFTLLGEKILKVFCRRRRRSKRYPKGHTVIRHRVINFDCSRGRTQTRVSIY